MTLFEKREKIGEAEPMVDSAYHNELLLQLSSATTYQQGFRNTGLL
jgi:hypothetical protein